MYKLLLAALFLALTTPLHAEPSAPKPFEHPQLVELLREFAPEARRFDARRVNPGSLTEELIPTQVSTSATREPIPEVPFQIKPTSYFFTLKNPRDFQVARPDAFDDMSHFKTNDLFFTIDADLDTVWAQYPVINPLPIWSKNRAMVRAIYVPSMDRTLDREQLETEWTRFEVGMKIFVDMSSLPVAVTHKPAMMVGLKIVTIDDATHTVVFRYLEGTPSYGEQVMVFSRSADNPNVTEISHKTWFRAYGRIMETMYPMYHGMMIRGMHGRYRTIIEGDAGP